MQLYAALRCHQLQLTLTSKDGFGVVCYCNTLSILLDTCNRQ